MSEYEPILDLYVNPYFPESIYCVMGNDIYCCTKKVNAFRWYKTCWNMRSLAKNFIFIGAI